MFNVARLMNIQNKRIIDFYHKTNLNKNILFLYFAEILPLGRKERSEVAWEQNELEACLSKKETMLWSQPQV